MTGDSAQPRFKTGDPVKVSARFPTGPRHIRTPFYIRGKTGVIERYCGSFGNPEQLAFGNYDPDITPLYRVRFDQAHVWDDYDGNAADKVEIEIFETWLEPITGAKADAA